MACEQCLDPAKRSLAQRLLDFLTSDGQGVLEFLAKDIDSAPYINEIGDELPRRHIGDLLGPQLLLQKLYRFGQSHLAAGVFLPQPAFCHRVLDGVRESLQERLS